METLLFVSPEEITQATILDGNVDVDKYIFCIEQTMDETLKTVLGSELYDKIYDDLDNDIPLTGLYLELFVDFVKPITKFQSVAEYITISPYSVSNYGTVKLTGENTSTVDQAEVERLSQIYNGKAQTYIERFYKWICKNPLDEYKTSQDEVNASKNINLSPGWRL